MKGNNMRGKQRGMTLIGFAIGLIIFCFFAYMAMILGPAYNEYFGVKKAMNFVADNTSSTSTDIGAMQRQLDKQFNVGYVDSVSGKEAKLIRDKKGNTLVVDYQVKKKFMYNIEFLITFHYEAELGIVKKE
jgi:hypothetical protein